MLVEEQISRKDQIEKVATRLFRLKGYKATSMRDLAQEMGMEAPSLYAHIRSKEEILQKICFRMADQFMESMQEIRIMDSKPCYKLEKALESHIRILINDLEASAVFWNEYKHMTGEALERFMGMKKEYEIKFIELLEEGVEKCAFEITDVYTTAMVILTALNSIHVWFRPDYTNDNDLVTEVTKTILKGIISK